MEKTKKGGKCGCGLFKGGSFFNSSGPLIPRTYVGNVPTSNFIPFNSENGSKLDSLSPSSIVDARQLSNNQEYSPSTPFERSWLYGGKKSKSKTKSKTKSKSKKMKGGLTPLGFEYNAATNVIPLVLTKTGYNVIQEPPITKFFQYKNDTLI